MKELSGSALFNVGDKVRVSPEVMGYGIAPIGIVSDVENFMGQAIISIDFIEPSEVGGRHGCTVSNVGFLELI